MTIKWETADNMMGIVSFTAMRAAIDHGEEPNIEGITEFARDMFEKYCKAVGITEIEAPEDENEDEYDFDDDDEDDEENNESAFSLTAKGEFALQYMEAGYSFEEACEVADLLFGKGE